MPAGLASLELAGPGVRSRYCTMQGSSTITAPPGVTHRLRLSVGRAGRRRTPYASSRSCLGAKDPATGARHTHVRERESSEDDDSIRPRRAAPPPHAALAWRMQIIYGLLSLVELRSAQRRMIPTRLSCAVPLATGHVATTTTTTTCISTRQSSRPARIG